MWTRFKKIKPPAFAGDESKTRIASNLEQTIALQNRLLAQITELSVELASLPLSTDLYAYLATKLKDLSGASVVTIGEYVASTRQVILRRFEGDHGLLSLGSRILGFDVTKFVTNIDDKAYQEIRRYPK